MTQDDLKPDDRRLADAAARALRASERELDAVATARLAAARARALEAARRPASAFGWWLPASAVAAGVLILLALPWRSPELPPSAVNLAEAEALEVLTDELDPEFYRELEFYEWLDGGNGSA